MEDSGHSLFLNAAGSVVSWGYDDDGNFVVPSGLNEVLEVSSGWTHGIALKENGTVTTWGFNEFGPITPPVGLADVVAVSAGGCHCLALRSDGTVVEWGSNFNGTEWVDAKAPAGLSDVVAISAGRFHNLALKADGTVVAWGYNLQGQADVPAGLSDVVEISAGGFHSLALKSDGSVVAWGMNGRGQTTVPASAASGVKLISAGMLHSLALHRTAGQPEITSSRKIEVGLGETINHQVVVVNAVPFSFSADGLPAGVAIDPLSGLISGVASGAARQSVRIRVATNQGRLTQSAWIAISGGLAPTDVQLSPAEVLENSAAGVVIGTLTAVDPDPGDSHTFELVDGDGAGDNGDFMISGNQLMVKEGLTRDFETNPSNLSIRVRARDASLNPREEVLSVQFLDDRSEDADGDGLTESEEEDIYQTSDLLVDSDSDGFGDSYEIQQSQPPNNTGVFPTGRMVVGWGRDDEGQTAPPLDQSQFIDLAAGRVHGLGLKSDGSVVAWGSGEDGQTTVPPEAVGVVAVGAGERHSLALKGDGMVVAWGSNDSGQTSVPASALSGVVSIAAGSYHNLALKGDGTVVAWGYNAYSQASVPAGLSGVVAIAAGGFHSLALKNDGTVVSWGSDWSGVGTVPLHVSGVVAIAAGGYHSLALKFDGTVVAWGYGAYGQVLVPVELEGVTDISAGLFHSVALKSDGTVAAWGSDAEGQSSIPQEAVFVHRIAAGMSHDLALRQQSGFPRFTDERVIHGWPGETISYQIAVGNAVASSFSAMGLPSYLSLNSVTGLVAGTSSADENRSVRITAQTDQGRLSRVVWLDTAKGVAPTNISLSDNVLAENSHGGTVVGTLSVEDPNVGDYFELVMSYTAAAPESGLFVVIGDQLVLENDLTIDYESGQTQLLIRVAVTDAGGNEIERGFVIQLTDDRTEDEDLDDIDEATEEDILGTSDSDTNDFITEDVDGDGISSLIEYAFNLNPTVPNVPLRLVAGGGILHRAACRESGDGCGRG